ncbi:type II toxin-antitoxin system RelE/ParE family toxin [Candidatus Daviesbacteria bacterium]|nr:type II toxin-antitoxin system RelE/ParE family toxin [Candidatus Daviesbacteria bacterium]
MDKWQVVFYISLSGNNPVQDFLDQYPDIDAKVTRILFNIKEYGLSSVIPHTKKLIGTPLWEIRILGQDSARIFYVTRKEKRILILHAFIKKTEKTPIKEINVALDRLKEVIDK